uniref:DCD domain-containing protein n=1 Tax=Leersia perrieri TaxID=77586 RepID=A0A0D9XE78_9ORYZ
MTQANSTATPTEGQTDKPQDADKEKTCYLSQEELGGVILYFSDDTFSECSTKQLFGLHHKQCDYVKKLKPRLPLFLFNSSDRKLYGIFEVISPVQLNTDQFAWISESLDASSEVTPPAQVYLSAKTECSPLTENQYRKVITNNYLDEKHGCFYLELDHEQTTELSSLFLPAQSMVPNDPQARKDVSDQVKCEYVSSSKVRFASTSSISRSNLANDASDKNTLMTTDNGRKDLQHSYASHEINVNWELYAPNIDTVKLRMSRAFCVNILPKCTNARTLSIEAYTLPNTNIEPCFFSKLITLCLDIFFDRGCMPTVLDLLESYPILELLKLQSCDPGYGKESDSFWDSQQRIFSPSLYKVELRGFVGTIREINLMNYLLKTAKSIQNFTIVVDSDSEIQVVGFPLFRSSMESIFVSRRSEVV